MASRRVKPTGGYELWWWYFMRISGLALVFLALGHLFMVHIVHNVEQINYRFVATRWADPTTGVLWRLWDLAMINLAILHGFNGIREILYEYIARPKNRIVVSTLIWIVAAGLIGIGSYAIVKFEKDKDYLHDFETTNGPAVAARAESSPSPFASASTAPTQIARQP